MDPKRLVLAPWSSSSFRTGFEELERFVPTER